MELTSSERARIREAASGKYERHAKVAMWFVLAFCLLLGLRFATLEPHAEYMYLLGGVFVALGVQAVIAMRNRVRMYQLIQKLAEQTTSPDHGRIDPQGSD
ncbi:MAG: hypothetical protein EA377_02840 [Phycisphaerales bacterium]|nr:MAG: hypothetical protein EA377_02840 [Phycisphaerales bacterium]